MTDETLAGSNATEDATPEGGITRRERFAALNKRLASKCYSFGGIAFLSLLLLLASDSCEDEDDPWPQRRDAAR